MAYKKADRRMKELRQGVHDLSKLPAFKMLMQWLRDDESGFTTSFFPWDEKVTIWNTAKRDTFVKILLMCDANLVSELLLEQNNKRNTKEENNGSYDWSISNGDEIDE